jgi:Lrp/AsnC family transcriptional regulator for asnA, asnC and gidA
MSDQKGPEDLGIDKLDKQILGILMNDASIPYTEIAKKLVVSGGTIHVRMKKLEELGVVRGNYLNINPGKVGYDVCAFLGIFLGKASEYRDAVRELEKIEEVVEMHYTTGTYSMFAKVICRDTRHLREVLNEKIQVIKGVQRTETFISLEESIRRQIRIL